MTEINVECVGIVDPIKRPLKFAVKRSSVMTVLTHLFGEKCQNNHGTFCLMENNFSDRITTTIFFSLRYNYKQEYIAHAYQELHIPDKDGEVQ